MAPLQPGRAVTLRFRAVLNASLAVGTRVTNTGTVYWNDPAQQASASVSIDVGGIPGVGLVNGRVWHDADFDRVYDASEIALAGWDVELYFNDSLAHAARTAADGVYRMSGVEPNYATTDTLRAAFPPARRRSRRRRCSAAPIPRSRTVCSGSPTSSCCRAATCRT